MRFIQGTARLYGEERFPKKRKEMPSCSPYLASGGSKRAEDKCPSEQHRTEWSENRQGERYRSEDHLCKKNNKGPRSYEISWSIGIPGKIKGTKDSCQMTTEDLTGKTKHLQVSGVDHNLVQ